MKKDREEPLRWESFDSEKQVVTEGNTVRQDDEKNVSVLYELPKKKAKSQKRILPPILLAIFSAVSIGLVLGMITLQMFVNIEQPVSGDNSEPVVATDIPAQEMHSIAPLSSYMLQAGVFSDVTNAEQWQQDYEERNLPTILWERDNQWYLFIGIYHGENEAQQRAETLREQGIDVFVKPWETIGNQLELTNEEAVLVEELNVVWQEALASRDAVFLDEMVKDFEDFDETSILGTIVLTENVDQYFLDWLYIYEQLGK